MIYLECKNPLCNKEFTVRFKSDARRRKYCCQQCAKQDQARVKKSGNGWWQQAYETAKV